MPITTSTTPYYDDYDETKQFQKILFKPGYPVQARELTQLQTILQNQIARFGKNIFQDGAMVIPGNVSYQNNYRYVKLQAGFTVSLSSQINKTVIGATSGVVAIIINTAAATTTDPDTIFVQYIASSATSKVFADGEALLDYSTGVGGATLFSTASTASTGTGTAVSIAPGVFFVNGFFAYVTAQTIILEKYSTFPTYAVGLSVVESIVAYTDDTSLLDNSNGSNNFAAPGADRHKISLQLTKIVCNSDGQLTAGTNNTNNFINLMVIVGGAVKNVVTRTMYGVIEDTMARRTFDTAGDFAVRAFPVDVREYRNNNRGAWAGTTNYVAGDIVTYVQGGWTFYMRAMTSGVSGVAITLPQIVTTPVTYGGSFVDNSQIIWDILGSPTAGSNYNFTVNSIPYNRGIYTPAQALINQSLTDTLANQVSQSRTLAVGLEPGKAYVRGYEIEKVSTTYIPVSKATSVQNAPNTRITATVGNYVRVNIPTAGNGAIPDFTSGVAVAASLYDRVGGNVVGTCNIRFVEFESGTPGSGSEVYKMSLYNIQMVVGKTFERTAKVIVSGVFSAAIVPTFTQISGSAFAAASATLGGFGTLFVQQLVPNDLLTLTPTIGAATYVVSSIASNNSLTLSASTTIGSSTAPVALYLETATIYEPQNNQVTFQAPFNYIKSIRDATDTAGGYSSAYSVTVLYTGTSTAGGQATITTSGTSTFASIANAQLNYMVQRTDTNVMVPATFVLNNSQSITVSGLPASLGYRIFATVNKVASAATERTKTYTTVAEVYSTQAAAQAEKILLTNTDGIKLVGVWQAATFGGTTYSLDITANYTFDNGRTSLQYGKASISLKTTALPPTGSIIVVYNYYVHGTGDYFTANSYPVDYRYIPQEARGMIDFRPDVGSNNVTPKRGVDFVSSVNYYLPRADKVVLDVKGNFLQIPGNPSVAPAAPPDNLNSMTLYTIYHPGYTGKFAKTDLVVQQQDNKRYTMRDIGKIEKRVDNLEYYTSLSLLEAETKSLTIPDQNGIDRYKNGFIVDGFKGHGVGDTQSIDYSCAIDSNAEMLRPKFNMKNIKLVESNTGSNYTLTGDLLTLPYTSVAYIQQMNASRVENINPYAIYTWAGNMTLNPYSDEWFEVQREPDLVIANVEGNYNATIANLSQAGILGTVWNAWQTIWSGSTTSINTVPSSADAFNRTGGGGGGRGGDS